MTARYHHILVLINVIVFPSTSSVRLVLALVVSMNTQLTMSQWIFYALTMFQWVLQNMAMSQWIVIIDHLTMSQWIVIIDHLTMSQLIVIIDHLTMSQLIVIIDHLTISQWISIETILITVVVINLTVFKGTMTNVAYFQGIYIICYACILHRTLPTMKTS